MEGDVRLSRRLPTMEETVNRKTGEFANYDVFISHRGPDTKTGFVGFLYKDLVAAGLQPFLDCKSVDIGDDSWKCIEHAIKRTPLAVVVFSESFAQSEWCLRELHVMLHTPSIKVLPVFYNVRPSEVRFPESGGLKDGFEKLASRHHQDNIIEQWRADLDQASKIMGWEHSAADRRLEVDLVKAIVGKVCELAQKPLPLDVGEYVVGVEQVAVEIMEKLDEKKHVLVLGLWGMGGIGKSTLARELYNQMRNRFPARCFIEDVTDKVSEAGGIVKVQNRILKGLCKNESGVIEDKSQGKVILEERLSKTKVLLVLDDVHDEVGDNSGMYYWMFRKMLAEGSMCIVTSRNSRVFGMMNSFDINCEVYIHNVQGLRSVDSMRMFSSFAFGGYWTVKQEFEELVENINKACGGVPLVVKVCGSLLKQEKNVKIWKEVLEKLNTGRIMDQRNIFDCLQISYNFLNEELQEMFLDIACALLGKPKDWAIRTWSHHHMSSTLGVRTLIEKALVTVNKFGCLSMHDHLRDMGREIARKKRIREGVIRRLWMPESLTLLKRNEESLDNLQTLMVFNLHASYIDLDVSHMKNLCIMICDSNINLVVQSLPKTLSWFDWVATNNDEEVKILPEIPHVNNLVILNLKGSNIEALCASIGNASTLEVMNLEYTRRLCRLPDSFGGLKNLEDLNLSWSSIKSLPESFGELSNLDSLNMASCGGLTSLPHSFGRLQKLRHITLSGSKIQCLPESFGGLSNLEVLNMSTCRGLTSLPHSFGRLQKLRHIDLSGSGIQCLPESFGGLSNLEVLNMSTCKGLTSLPHSFGRLQKLRPITLSGSKIQCLPESFGGLNNLEVLNVSLCQGLTSLPDSFGHLQKLRDITLLGSGIQCLPESFGGLNNLEVLNVSLCQGLTSLPNSFGRLSNLEDLNLSSCRNLMSLPDSLGGLGNLRALRFDRSGIECVPECFGSLSSLERLNMTQCHKFIKLPESFGCLCNLRVLNLRCSTLIEILPSSFGGLSNLEELNLWCCENLIMLPDSFGSLRNLRTLTLGRTKIENLPESFGELSNLQELDLYYCSGLKALPQSFTQLRNLQMLDLQDCPASPSFRPFQHCMPVNCVVKL